MSDSPSSSESDNTAKPASIHRGLRPPWRKGESGNPNGRPRTAEEVKSVKLAAREHTVEAVSTLTHIAAKGKSESARVAAACAILDRGWGKPHQEMTQHIDGPVYEGISWEAPPKPADADEDGNL